MHLVLETAFALEVVVHLVLDELRRNGDLDLLEQHLDELVARGGALREDALLSDALGQALAELGDRVELARDLREVVVGLGELALLDGLDGHGDLGLGAGVVATDESGAEGGVLTGGERLDRVVDALEQLAGTDLVGDALGAVDLGTVDRRDEVELDEVALGGRTVDRDQRAEARAHVVELGVERGVIGLDGVDRHGDAVVGGKLDLGADIHLDVDEQVTREVLLVRPLRDVGSRTADDAQLVLDRRLAEELVQALVDGVLDDGATTDALVNDRSRDLTLTEAGDLHVLSDVLVRVSDAGLEVVRGDRDGELDPGRGQLLDGAVRHAGVFSL